MCVKTLCCVKDSDGLRRPSGLHVTLTRCWRVLSRVTGSWDPPWTLLLMRRQWQSSERIEKPWPVGRQDGFSSRTWVLVTRPSEGHRVTAETVSVMWGERDSTRQLRLHGLYEVV